VKTTPDVVHSSSVLSKTSLATNCSVGQQWLMEMGGFTVSRFKNNFEYQK